MHSWKVLKTEADYKKALARTLQIFDAEKETPELDELELLLVLVKDYEDKNVPLPAVSPTEIIKMKLKEKGLKMKDLEPVIGSKGHVSSILSGKREINLKMAAKLHRFLGIPPQIFFAHYL